MNEIQNYIEEFQKEWSKESEVVVYNNGNINYYGNTNTKCYIR